MKILNFSGKELTSEQKTQLLKQFDVQCTQEVMIDTTPDGQPFEDWATAIWNQVDPSLMIHLPKVVPPQDPKLAMWIAAMYARDNAYGEAPSLIVLAPQYRLHHGLPELVGENVVEVTQSRPYHTLRVPDAPAGWRMENILIVSENKRTIGHLYALLPDKLATPPHATIDTHLNVNGSLGDCPLLCKFYQHGDDMPDEEMQWRVIADYYQCQSLYERWWCNKL